MAFNMTSRKSIQRLLTNSWTFNRKRIGVILLGLVLLGFPIPQAWGQVQRTIEALDPADVTKSAHQRRVVDELARRRLGIGLRPNGNKENLEILQRLISGRFVAMDEALMQQSLGLVLGNVMQANLPLRWVVLDDQLGRSRALRWREGDALYFPITMISKRMARGESVRIRALYDQVVSAVKVLEARPR